MAGTAGDDDDFSGDRLAIDGEPKRLPGQVHRLDAAELNPGAETLGLLLEARHKLVAIDAFREARIILNHGRRGQQAARLVAGQDERLQVGSRRIKRGRQASAARTDDNDFFHKDAQVNFGLCGWQAGSEDGGVMRYA